MACSSRVSTVHACYSTYVIKLQRRTKKKRKNGERKQGNEEQGREKRVNSLKKKRSTNQTNRKKERGGEGRRRTVETPELQAKPQQYLSPAPNAGKSPFFSLSSVI